MIACRDVALGWMQAEGVKWSSRSVLFRPFSTPSSSPLVVFFLYP